MNPAISRTLVREALNRILASPTFEKSGRARELLQYLVDEELEGRGGNIKGFTIAVDVFGRDAAFDASNDPLVRVHVGRLRELLTQYYTVDGASAQVRIRIPKGGYRPDYQLLQAGKASRSRHGAETAMAAEADSEPDDFFASELRQAMPASFKMPPAVGKSTGLQFESGDEKVMGLVMRHVRGYWVAFTLIIAMLGYLLYSQLPPDDVFVTAFEPNAAQASSPRRGFRGALSSEMLPGIDIVVEGDAPFLKNVSAELRNAIPRFDVVRLLRAESQTQAVNSTSYTFRITPGASENQVVVSLESRSNGTVLLSETVENGTGVLTLKDQAAKLLTRALSVSGVVYSDLQNSGTSNSLTQCILLSHEYFRDATDLAHRKAYDCFLELSRRGARSPLVYAEMGALMHDAVTSKRSYPPSSSSDAAQQLAEKAIVLNPESASAHRAMAYVLSRTGNGGLSVSSAKRAYELNPYNLDITATYGYSLVMTAGDFVTGAALLRKAVDTASSVQPWWIYGLVLSLYVTDDIDAAYAYSDGIRTRKRPHYFAIRMILAHETGNVAEADELRAKLMAEDSAFAKDPEGFCKQARYPEALTRKFLEGLEKAGFPPAG